MPLYDYRIAKKVLSEAEKDRILAIFLNTTVVSPSTTITSPNTDSCIEHH